jgi:transcriptional regulator with XRE-family HTH domain
MTTSSKNLVTGRQLRAARVLAGLTQKTLGEALGVDERAVRFWEQKRNRKPTGAPNDARIEQVLLQRGVILFADPTPGARLARHQVKY